MTVKRSVIMYLTYCGSPTARVVIINSCSAATTRMPRSLGYYSVVVVIVMYLFSIYMGMEFFRIGERVNYFWFKINGLSSTHCTVVVVYTNYIKWVTTS